MKDELTRIIPKKEVPDFKEFVSFLFHQQDKKHFLRNDILILYDQFCTKTGDPKAKEKSAIYSFIRKIQELFLLDEHIAIMHRRSIARYAFYLVRSDGEYMTDISTSDYLDLKDRIVDAFEENKRHLHIDFLPFYDYAPSIRDPKNIGNGIRFLNRYLSSNIFNDPDKWNARLFEFLKLHKDNGVQLLVNGAVLSGFKEFFTALEDAIEWLETRKPDAPYASVEKRLKKEGFEPGWGNTVSRILETMKLLTDLINEPSNTLLEQFIALVPMPLISKVAIISPHGWFGQSNVLGKPDTGGQVIYILDQVKALERHLIAEMRGAGIDSVPKIVVVTRQIPEAGDTNCAVRMEQIHETQNAWILRVPFKDKDENILKNWIPRFKIWPYLETFADDVAKELLSEFPGRPDLIIGNYSDGNLVATLLSDKLDVIQCTIAHALEKTKYLFSDLYWQPMEKDYHFSIQFTADMLAMNKSDFIITSTHQEIMGDADTMGQYESYQFYTMPGLYQVISGVNLFAPKFNVIPPGVDEKLFFPHYERDKRINHMTDEMTRTVFHEASERIHGHLDDPDKMPIFTMARLDKIKNITGLIEAFGMSEILKQKCNLIFSAGTIHAHESDDLEEQEEIAKVYQLIDQYNLGGKIRWLPVQKRVNTGEIYRVIADKKGVFVQPALFEAFGLTILEAMYSGLPTFGPVFGGPQEIIIDDESGYLLNTSKPGLIAQKLEAFFTGCEKDPDLWRRISENGLQRVMQHFNWRSYSKRLISLAKLYGFWRFSESARGKVKLDRYCDFLYHFIIKEKAEQMLANE